MTQPSVTALRGPHPPQPHEVVGATRAGAGTRPALLPAPVARSLALGALVAFGAHHWMAMLEPPAAARAWYAAAAALTVAGGMWSVGRARRLRWARTAATGAILFGAVVLALLGAGVQARHLAPYGWGELAAGLQRGLEVLPGARVPYRGLDEWLRTVLALGGTGLAVAAGALAAWPRAGGRAGFPAAVLVPAVALYAVPAVALDFRAEFLRGAGLALLVVAFLRLERLRRAEARAAAFTGAAAAVAALAVAPALDGLDPWWDYERWALGSAASTSTSFVWAHDYGPLNWPRDGRELLRVRSPVRAYWKADQLDVFNGGAWAPDRTLVGAGAAPRDLLPGVPADRLEEWTIRARVAVRNLESGTLVTAGTTRGLDVPGRPVIPTSRPGVQRTTGALRRGDAYEFVAYVPRPSGAQLAAAGKRYPPDLRRFTRVGVRTGGDGPGIDGNPRVTVVDVRRFGAGPTQALIDPELRPEPAGGLLARSSLARTWRLSRRLLSGVAGPHEYVRRVEAHLADGFGYSEAPPRAAGTIDGFLFEARSGYCQQFSGAMALLLRLAGIPARVATGFAPGAYDEAAREYVVRDTDAHSWVEVWFPGVGWVVRDPTPTSAPPRAQASEEAASPVRGDVRDVGITARPGSSSPVERTGGSAWWWVAAVLGASTAAWALRRRGRTARRSRSTALDELGRALRAAGGELPPGTTLATVERRFAARPAVAAYARTLREERYGLRTDGPTPAQRRALRRAVAAGGVVRLARAWWAVPPRRRW